jgi:hypothetical protein
MTDDRKIAEIKPLRTITRLLIGGLLLGSELLDQQIRVWEGSNEQADLDQLEVDHLQADGDEPLPETLPVPQLSGKPRKKEPEVRYALIGLIFEGEEKLEDALAYTKNMRGIFGRVLYPLTRPIQKIGTSPSVRDGVERLTNRGQSTITRWIERGRDEEAHSRKLTETAAVSTVDHSINYMAHNPALEELVQTQSVSLAKQILELIRGNAVSADYYFEGLIRYMFRRRPRYLLPAPDQILQEQATWTLKHFREENL